MIWHIVITALLVAVLLRQQNLAHTLAKNQVTSHNALVKCIEKVYKEIQ